MPKSQRITQIKQRATRILGETSCDLLLLAAADEKEKTQKGTQDRRSSYLDGVYQIGEVYARSCVTVGTCFGKVTP